MEPRPAHGAGDLQEAPFEGGVAWVRPQGTGVEQGWDLTERLPGAGPLVLELTLDGARVVASTDTGASLVDGAGRAWSYSGLSAWDADGQDLPATLAAVDGGLRITVWDEGARWPLVVDPLLTTADASFTGTSTAGYFGYAVDGAGDVNGDGYPDVVIGASNVSSGNGATWIFWGTATGIGTSGTEISAPASGGSFGESVSTAGDVDGDGLDEVIIGAPYVSSNRGSAYLYGWTGAEMALEATLNGTSGSNMGMGVGGGGDVNGDGYADVVVGAPRANSSFGGVYVFHGSSTGLSTTASWSTPGTGDYEDYGYSVAMAGDIDNDGYDDIAVGAPREEVVPSYYDGAAYVYYGSSGGITSTDSTYLPGPPEAGYRGNAVSSAGDVNGDGFGDLVVGAYDFLDRVGDVYVFRGSAVGLNTAATTLDTTMGYAGTCVAGVGDVNGDGYDDVISGSPYAEVVELFEGSATGIVTTPSTTLRAPTTGGGFGTACNGAGDLDGDGYTDILVGSPELSSNRGAAWAFLGYADVDGDGIPATTDCDDTDPSVYPGAREVCDSKDVDEDCDGLADSADPGASGSVAFYLDSDGDGWGLASTTVSACDPPPGYASMSGDCDDGEAAVHPGAPEICDGLDDDCDGALDTSETTDAATWYRDGDGDGYGDPSSTTRACTVPSGYVADATDCDDTDGAAHPGGDEAVGDLLDGDCDGQERCYVDGDQDGARSEGVVTSSDLDCDDPGEASAADPMDCDDSTDAVGPGSGEVVGDGLDADCDGQELCYADTDQDGWRTETDTLLSTDTDCDDPGEALATAPVGDCDPADPSVHPDATETAADGTDQDCDGGDLCYADADQDGFRTDETSASVDLDCDDPGEATAATTGGDCDDQAATVFPGASETPTDGVDQDCDGGDLCYADADQDGFTVDQAVSSTSTSCDEPGVGPAPGEAPDCDDGDATVFPGAEEVVNDGIDQDCDGGDRAGGCGCSGSPTSPRGLALAALGLGLLLVRRRSAWDARKA